jgi:hypothetical protein
MDKTVVQVQPTSTEQAAEAAGQAALAAKAELLL